MFTNSKEKEIQFAVGVSDLAIKYNLVAEIDWEKHEINFVGNIDDNKMATFIGEVSFLAERLEGECCNAIFA